MFNPKEQTESPKPIARVDRLSVFLRCFALRVDFIDGPLGTRAPQFAVAIEGNALVAMFSASDIRDFAAGRDVLMTAGISFGGARNPLLVALQRPIEARPQGREVLAMVLGAMVGEWQAMHCGSAATVERLCEAAVIQLLRKAVADGSAGPGLLLGLSHANLHRALIAIHERPQQNWRIADLAELAAMSRSAFMATFTSILGCPPAAYLTVWRLSEAKRHTERGLTIKQTAREVGFGSAEALSRAYRRVFRAPLREGGSKSFATRRSFEKQRLPIGQ